MIRKAMYVFLLVSALGCSTQNIRQKLLESLNRERELGRELTHFSYVCDLETKRGIMYVGYMREVLSGMPAPRGYNTIVFFDQNKNLKNKFRTSALPLWCEEARLYLFGRYDRYHKSCEKDYKCNVIDFGGVNAEPKFRFEERYGSNSGSEEDFRGKVNNPEDKRREHGKL